MSVFEDPRIKHLPLKLIVDQLVQELGWFKLSQRIKLRCFSHQPSLDGSVKFLNKTEWAKEKVIKLYLEVQFGDEPESPSEFTGFAKKP